jgi:hypothetical protein
MINNLFQTTTDLISDEDDIAQKLTSAGLLLHEIPLARPAVSSILKSVSRIEFEKYITQFLSGQWSRPKIS